MRKEATFNSIVRVRNTETAIMGLATMFAMGVHSVTEALDKRIIKFDPKFGWEVADMLEIGHKYKADINLLKKQLVTIKVLQEKIIEKAEAQEAEAVVQYVKQRHKKAKAPAKKEPAIKAGSGQAALDAFRASLKPSAKAPAKKAKATKRPKRKAAKREKQVQQARTMAQETDRAAAQAQLVELIAKAQVAARRRNPSRIDEANAALDRDVQAFLSMMA